MKRLKSERGVSGKSLLAQLNSPPVRAITILIVVCFIFIFYKRLSTWWKGIFETLLANFGVGLVFLGVAIIVLLVLWSTKRLILLWTELHWWLGAFTLIAVVMGIASFFNTESGVTKEATLGGYLGVKIAGPHYIRAVLRLIGITLLGLLFISPKFTWRLIVMVVRVTYFIARNVFRVCKLIFYRLKNFFSAHPPDTWFRKAPAFEDESVRAESGEMQRVSSEAETETQQVDKQQEKKAETKPGESKKTIKLLSIPRVIQLPLKPIKSINFGRWDLPSVNLVDSIPQIEFKEVDAERTARIIEDALSSYGVEAKVVQINIGPTVTQFGVEPGWDRKYKEIKEKDKNGNIRVHLEEVSKIRVKVERITSLANDLALALAAPSIRIEAPVPGKPVVGIEVPNTTLGIVGLRGVMESSAFQKLKSKTKLTVALGKGPGGESLVADLTKMPHLLIAGQTGSGKTVCLNAIITCLLMHCTPDDLRFIMVDPKRVEMVPYNGIPHLENRVIVEGEIAVQALENLNKEMDRRYRQLAVSGSRNIDAHNKSGRAEKQLPYIVLVIDELADLMMSKPESVEPNICRLAQLARATGIHLIVATQRPSVDVVTGLIKANFPTRISFAVASQVDSRTILDCVGAEKLLGRGDMLYLPPEAAKPRRLQGCYVSDTEIDRIVAFWKAQNISDTKTMLDDVSTVLSKKDEPKEEDPYLVEARKIAGGKPVSADFIKRKLKIGLPKAQQLVEILEKERKADESGTDVSPGSEAK